MVKCSGWKHIMAVHLGKKMFFWGLHLYSFGGNFLFISFNILRNTSNGFLTQSFQHNSYYLQMIMFFQQLLCLHMFMFVWMKNLIQIYFVKSHEWNSSYKLKWDNEFICNIWLSTSSNLVIVWMVFEVYLHFAVYRDDYNFLINIF
jgi:hypothetical protein